MWSGAGEERESAKTEERPPEDLRVCRTQRRYRLEGEEITPLREGGSIRGGREY